MSLINEMLRDLETRRASAERGALPNEVRPLPPPRRSVAPKLLAALLLVVLGVGAAAWLRSSFEATRNAIVGSNAAPALSAAPAAPLVQEADTRPRGETAQAPVAVPAGGQDPAAALASHPAAAAEVPAKDSPAKDSSPAKSESGEGADTAKGASRPPDAPSRPASPTGRKAQGSVDFSLKVATALLMPPRTEDQAPLPTPKPAPAPVESGPVVIEKQVRLGTPRERADSEYRKAVTLMGQGRTAEAISGLRAALHEDASYAPARLALSSAFVEQRRLDEAQAVLQEGLAQSPNQYALAMKLARIHVERGELKAAAESLQKAASAGAGSSDYRALYGGVLQRLGQHRAAIDEYQAAVRISPQSGVWWMGLGISLEAEGRNGEARDAFMRARASGSLTPDLDRYVEQRLSQLQ